MILLKPLNLDVPEPLKKKKSLAYLCKLINSPFGLSYKLPFSWASVTCKQETPAFYGVAFIINVEIIFLFLYWDIFTEFPLPILSEYSWRVGTWTNQDEEGGNHHAIGQPYRFIYNFIIGKILQIFSNFTSVSCVWKNIVSSWRGCKSQCPTAGSMCLLWLLPKFLVFVQGSICKHRIKGWLYPFHKLAYLASCRIGFQV